MCDVFRSYHWTPLLFTDISIPLAVCDHYLAPQPLIYYHAVHKDDTEGDFTIPAPGFAVPFWPLQGPNGSRRYGYSSHHAHRLVTLTIYLDYSNGLNTFLFRRFFA